MKKIINYILTIIFSFGMICNNVFAADYSISVTSKSVTVGNSVSLTIKASGVAGRFNITSSDSSVVSVSSSSEWIDDASKTITLITKKAGSAKITITPVDVTGYDGNAVNGVKTVTITVKNKTTSSSSSGSTVPQRVKSSNSYLTSLTVSGYELDSKFDKETLEYSVTIPAETEKIKINAQLADSNAKVTGVGEVEVSDGLNTFQIVVTAENGSKRTYVLKATVMELEPIEVKIENDKFTVVRKRKDLPEISEYFTEKNIKIGEETVEGYYNEELNYYLVGLKDDSGNIEYYIYKNGKYALYKEYTFNGVTLQILDKEVDKSFKKTNFTYDGDKIDAYQEVKLDLIKNTYALDNNDVTGNQFYLFYAKNVETGKDELYQYDAVDKTVQRYNTLILDMYKERSDKYYMMMLGSILILGVSIITFSTIIISKSNKKNKNIDAKKRVIKSTSRFDELDEDIIKLDIDKEVRVRKETSKGKKNNKKHKKK